MKRLLITMILLLLLPMQSIAAEGQCGIDEKQLLGHWKGESDNGFFEEFLFREDGAERVFTSWRDHRPSVTGTWTVKSCLLEIYGSLSFTFNIQTLKDNVLVLYDIDENSSSTYRKLK